MNIDFLIIGQGLAGSALALELLKRGRSVLVVDRQDVGSSTRVAAGLITPLTGKGMNPAWEQEKYLSVAEAFYHELEKESGRKLYRKTPVVRAFLTEKEAAKWAGKRKEMARWAYDRTDCPFKNAVGSIEMPDGAWLDTGAFLRVVKDKLEDKGAWMESDFSEGEVTMVGEELLWKDVRARRLILCQGAYGLGKGGWFGDIDHRSAKGEVLTVRLDGLDETKRYHANGWIAPRGGGIWKAGANYNWKDLDSEPTEAGKKEVLDKLATWLDFPMEIMEHTAGVRPIIQNSFPVTKMHSDYPNIGFFNGLGSKGSLMAPGTAAQFADKLSSQLEVGSA